MSDEVHHYHHYESESEFKFKLNKGQKPNSYGWEISKSGIQENEIDQVIEKFKEIDGKLRNAFLGESNEAG